jgi:hypothetical protein
MQHLGRGLGVVLMQEENPLLFTNKQLCDINLAKSIYEKEMMHICHWEAFLDQGIPPL